MKAIVLAAGEGKRLQPLTLSSPKCLVNLFGKSILEWQLQVFRSCNINDISIVTGYLKDMIKFDDVTYFENPKFLLISLFFHNFPLKFSSLNKKIS